MDYLKKSILISFVMILICGVVYPLGTTLIGGSIFPYKASGSILKKDGKEVGSELIGQEYKSDRYFKTRIHSKVQYNEGKEVKESGSNNLPANSEELKTRVLKDIESFKTKNIPSDFITESGSGLDPHISVESALFQVKTIAKARNIDEKILISLIEKNKEGKFLGLYGAEKINVLKLNLELDKIGK